MWAAAHGQIAVVEFLLQSVSAMTVLFIFHQSCIYLSLIIKQAYVNYTIYEIKLVSDQSEYIWADFS